MPKVSDEHKDQKRELVFESAYECFAEKGYHQTTMDDIVEKSQTSKGLVYNYFSSKEELYVEMNEIRIHQAFAALEERFLKIDSAAGKLKELFSIIKNSTMAHDEMKKKYITVDIEFWINSAWNEQLRSIMIDSYKTKYLTFIKEIVQEGMNKKEFRSDLNPDIAAGMFWAYADGIATHFSVVPDYNKDDVLDKTEQIYMAYLTRK
jgi:AcrR family transcriptional regulator